MQVRCNDCASKTTLSLTAWRCSCGGAWEPAEWGGFDPDRIVRQDYSLWRYGVLLGLDVFAPVGRMGVGWTPLVPIQLSGRGLQLKLEFLSPSGSFKDRGVNTMVHQLLAMGAHSVVEDSSGNAGASLAAHAARFGLQADIYVPASTSLAKIQQIEVYGIKVIPIEGPRQEAEQAAQAAVGEGKAYASHAYHPAYLVGQSTAAFELWEQLGHRAPDWIILPVAQGGQFLGYWFGFSQLMRAGLIEQVPHLVAAQAAQIAPIHHAWQAGLDHVPALDLKGATVAEGIAISRPVRGRRILQALTETDGRTVAVGEEEILAGQTELAHHGYFVEPTSAVAVAAYYQLSAVIDPHETVVIPLTGNGLKSGRITKINER